MASVTNVSTVVIGAGHSGLAMSHRLTGRSIDHVVLERGEVGNSWRTERWDSLRLLTPNSQTRLPGMAEREAEPDGFMTMPEVVQFIDDYAATIDAPVQSRTTVTGVTAVDDGYAVATDDGEWRCAALVLASGPANLATVPALAVDVPPSVEMVSSMT
jgi:putative flavoprotein involved in K+ transport